ncbi:hypothetical protein [Arcobacter aquimarinus]|uniref:Uncharacterized protein n=1 Tax=Arcobacter aquimarinus TaxID=1315211 RepID=A0AAE7E0K1_9BACT|nr:hypothetical protein [Arcobacter aquimarinus]QKE24922.1 hypothetical protein AAQM_0142 [Arcobacter aquimarinus]RXI36832.1 hypothetical protein CP986_00760 [Arcobacter aquimarinus]
MGMFDVEFHENLNLKEGNSNLFEFFKKQFLKNKNYEIKIEKDSLDIEKLQLGSFLRYKLNITTSTNKKEKTSQAIITAELQDTLILTIFIVLAIAFTYGLGIIPIIMFTYFQKVKATKYLKELLENYKSTI